jgi:OOP family OmpA-OmpF porin
MRDLIAIVVLVGGVFSSTSLQHGTNDAPGPSVAIDPLATANLSISMARNELSIAGMTASSAHERALRQLAADQLGNYNLRTEFYPGLLPDPGWDAISIRLLYAIAVLESGEATLQRGAIGIRGVSSDAGTFGLRVEFLRELLPPEFELHTDVVFVRSTTSFDELCQKAFSEIIFNPVSFKESSAEIRQASFVTLDRITDFAHDCQNVKIAITGHTDASGDETWNQQLSLARAQAVADHIARNGIDPRRLVVAGLGSSVPIADNSTAQGRELNRRIEFEIR